MAGGKETPRQKMIGMMYLVLTALLALQVSNAVLEKFAIINVTLEEMAVDSEKKNVALVAAIEEAGKGKTNPKVLEAVENAKKVRELTKATIEHTDQLKATMIKLAGATEVDERVINDHSMKVATMMITGKPGKEYEKKLQEYVAGLRQLTKLEFDNLAKPPREIEFFKNDSDHDTKSFLEFTFENTPAIAALTSVTEIQTQIYAYENRALERLAKDAEAGTVKFDKIVPMVKPKAEVVAAGAKYEADMFITASAEGIAPQMFRNGQPLPVSPDPVTKVMMGKVSFMASASNYDANGQSKQSFEAEIRLSDNPDEIFKQRIEYIVVKPTIKVTTGNRPTLYLNCGNSVTFEVPSLGTTFNPSFSARGAEVVKSDKIGRVTIIPKERKVAVTLANAGAILGVEDFDVKPIPRPKFVARDNQGKDIDLKNGIRATSATGLRISADPDENFKNEVPQDANYRIRNMEVSLVRGTQRVASVNPTSELVDLAPWRSQMRPGDRIVVDIKNATRRTFQGEDEKVSIGTEIINIPIQ
jgi:gliding motility-associated protein GldM